MSEDLESRLTLEKGILGPGNLTRFLVGPVVNFSTEEKERFAVVRKPNGAVNPDYMPAQQRPSAEVANPLITIRLRALMATYELHRFGDDQETAPDGIMNPNSPFYQTALHAMYMEYKNELLRRGVSHTLFTPPDNS